MALVETSIPLNMLNDFDFSKLNDGTASYFQTGIAVVHADNSYDFLIGGDINVGRDPNGVLLGFGTLTGYELGYLDSAGNAVNLVDVTGLSVPFSTVVNASMTLDRSDDLAVIKTALAGNDTIWGSDYADVLAGFDGDDLISSFGGNDFIYGGGGDDYLSGGSGADLIDGGDGSDAAAYINSIAGVTVSLATGVGSGGDAEGDTLYNIEVLSGSDFGDRLTGNAAGNLILGNGGDDVIDSGGGDDRIHGDDGNDRINGGLGIDTMLGDAGNDVYVVDNAGDTVDESVTGSGIDTVQSAISFSLMNSAHVLGNFENLTLLGSGNINATGNTLNNVLTGNAGINVLNGGAGADNMRGGAGNDVYRVDNAGDIVNESLSGSTGIDTVQSAISFSLANTARVFGAVENLTLLGSGNINGSGNALANTIVGNAAANVLNGAAGNDRIIGGAGNDTLIGNTGIDTLTGGLGNDKFRFLAAPTAANRDAITDFANATGNNDLFQMENAVFTALGAGVGTAHMLNAAHFWSNTTGLAHDANDHIIYNKTTGALFYDSNGNAAGGSVQIATLSNHAAITAADFQVI